MSNKLISIGLMLVLMWPLAANERPDYKTGSSAPNRPSKDLTTLPGIGEDLVILGGSSVNGDEIVNSGSIPATYNPFGVSRGTADTLGYLAASGGWFSYFYGYQNIGDAFMTMFKMPADGILKGVNVPMAYWGDGDQQITISLHKLSYPYATDGTTYSADDVNGAGWLGGYDMNEDGWVTIEGTDYTAGGTAGVCNPASAPVIANAQDPLGTEDGVGPAGVPTKGLIWPNTFTSYTGTPESHPVGADVWAATSDYGEEPELMAGDWVGVLVRGTGAGGGEDPTLGFYYETAAGQADSWVSMKFYGECGGTSGNGGWHIRGWMFHMQLAVELTGDRGPQIVEVSPLPTTLSTGDREVSAHITDDNPSGEAAGVSTVTMSYQIDSLTATVNSVTMSLSDGTTEDGTWTGTMPGASTGQTVYWNLSAYDNNANATSTQVSSYFIFQATAGNGLVFNNQSRLYGGSDAYIRTRYFGNDSTYDLWDASYGGITGELTGNYDMILELAGHGGPVFVNDDEVSAWWDGSKTYIVTGDEWLGLRSGWANGPTAQGSVAREILGVAGEYNDVNYAVSGDDSGISRLMAVADDPITGALNTFMQTGHMTVDTVANDTTYSAVYLNYDPAYETSSTNWLDGVDANDGWTVAMTAYGGILDSNGAVPADAEEYNVMVYGQAGNGGKSAFLAFDPIALNTVPTYYWIGAYPYNGGLSPLMGAMAWVGGVASADEEISLPNEFALKGNYPNPFNPSTNIAYSINMNSKVNVKIYSLLGEEIASLFNGDVTPGTHEVRWNGVNNAGAAVASGMYIYRVEANNQALTGKMMLMK